MTEDERRERDRSKSARWRAANPDRAAAQRAKDYASQRSDPARLERARVASRASYLRRRARMGEDAWKARGRAYSKKWRETHDPSAPNRIQRLRYKGLTDQAYDALLDGQGGVCAICHLPERVLTYGRARRLAVDHDHACCSGTRACGKCIRGLLCTACNYAIAKFDDDPERMRAAAIYVERRLAA